MSYFFIESDCTNPYYNLAMEQYLFEEMPKSNQYFMLWQNDNSIIIGKNQNTIEEINIKFVKDNNVNVVRRLSGGGAVYHDLGNINFTFIMDADQTEKLNFETFTLPVINVLKKLGISAELNGRNDILINGRKFSGNAQYIKQGRVMHHGTILFSSNLNVVSQALNVNKDKIESKGLKSIRSRITNISDYIERNMGISEFKAVLKRHMFGRDGISEYSLTDYDKEKIFEIKRERYDTWEWNYGYSPQYKIVKKRNVEDCGNIEIHMNVEEGYIKKFKTYGDFFGSCDISVVEDLLVGQKLNESKLKEVLCQIDLNQYYHNLPVDKFIDIILR